jgi:membrane-bound metal-dependent hydrolase YbcI (DUF457 family)
MIAPTHIAFAEFIYLLILTTTGVPLNVANGLAIAVASVMADVDTGASTIGKILPFISHRIERRYGHRTLTHSMLFCVLLCIVTLPLLWLEVFHRLVGSNLLVCLLCGYVSHPLLDTMTIHGAKLLYPFSNVKCVFPLEVNSPHRYRIQTGSKQDKALGVMFLLACLPTYLVAHQGYERFIRYTQKNVESAVRDYNEFSKECAVTAEIAGHNLFSKERIAGSFSVNGTLDDNTLLFTGSDGRLHTLGKEYRAEYAAERIVCNKGELVRTEIQTLDMTDRPLSQIPQFLDNASQNSLFGTLNTEAHVKLPKQSAGFNPISGGGGELEFKYATYGDIQECGLEDVIVLAGQLTIRTITPRSATRLPESGLSDWNLSDSGRTLVPSESGSAPSGSGVAPSGSGVAPSGGGVPASESGRYVRILLETGSDEGLNLSVQRGDTVQEGSLLAERVVADAPKRKRQILQQQIEAVEEELDVRLLELENRIAEARQQAELDSVAAVLKKELLARGYAPSEASRAAGEGFDKSSRKLFSLLSSRSAIHKGYGVRLIKLKSEVRVYTEKEQKAAASAAVRSTACGIVTEIRQFQRKGKTQTTFYVRRP